MKKIKVGLLGFGTVGAGVADILVNKKDIIAQNSSIDIDLKYICDKDITTDRGVNIPKKLLINDPEILLNDEDIDIVIELIGGCDFAKNFILRAAKKRKHIVTANKALLSTHWEEIIDAVSKNNVDIMFEASVAGGVPIIKAMRESLVGNKINTVMGIINGTANYILTRMKDNNLSMEDALKEAQKLGYAEADPTFDIEGIDTAHKLSILVSLAFGVRAKLGNIYTEGITKISLDDILYADQLGYVIKLLAIAKEKDGNVEARVHPTLISKDNLLSAVDGVFNAVYVNGDSVGDLIFYGKGAGRYPTASAITADVVELAKRIGTDYRTNYTVNDSYKNILNFQRIESNYYVRLAVEDKPGVLASIANILAKNNINISSVIQLQKRKEGCAPLVIMLHKAREKDVQKAIKKINELKVAHDDCVLIRVEE